MGHDDLKVSNQKLVDHERNLKSMMSYEHPDLDKRKALFGSINPTTVILDSIMKDQRDTDARESNA